jgi:hypothetical protein
VRGPPPGCRCGCGNGVRCRGGMLGAGLCVRLGVPGGLVRPGRCGVLADHTRRMGGGGRWGALRLVAAALPRDRGAGEIYLIAVDPAPGVREVGTALTGVATGRLRRSGLLVAVIKAGGLGHAAGGVCEEAGYTALPAVRFFRALQRIASAPGGHRTAFPARAPAVLVWHRRQPRRQAEPGTGQAAGEGVTGSVCRVTGASVRRAAIRPGRSRRRRARRR